MNFTKISQLRSSVVVSMIVLFKNKKVEFRAFFTLILSEIQMETIISNFVGALAFQKGANKTGCCKCAY